MRLHNEAYLPYFPPIQLNLIASFLFYVAKTSAVDALQIILTMWYNMAFTGMLVSMFVILYQNDVFGRMTDGLRFYGRMSLTNYISQSIIGSLIFFPYALGLAFGGLGVHARKPV